MNLEKNVLRANIRCIEDIYIHKYLIYEMAVRA